ncbi:MAG TPA: glycoside hydrolase family 38 C-terminal domain-containing protein [bacterium]|nr:glycoside hydrolase family 38 C-terminal domain-containing protein [bacterium]
MKKGYLCFHHHSDLVWRRTKEGYDRVREEQILYNLKLFKKYPEFKFCFAQSDIIRTFLRENPEYEVEIRRLVKEGRIYFVGGTVSIPDTNLTSGESIVRNILLGRKFYKEHFDVDIEIAWFMDAFGMSGQLPQILKKSNFKYLLPGRTPGLPENCGSDFMWAGIDGSGIITALATGRISTHTHICNLPVVYAPQERMESSIQEITNQEKENVFVFYCTEEGFFDEKIFSLLKKFKEIEITNPIDYYQTLEGKTLAGYKGELNPEFTGCYTTRIEVKKLNRKAENVLVNCEKINSIAKIVSKGEYDKEFFNWLWEKLSICQFHDGICGCHIDSVYNELTRELNEIIEKGNSQLCSFLHRILPQGNDEKLFLFNTNPWERRDVVCIEGKEEIDLIEGGRKIKTQHYKGNTYFVVDVPSFGYKLLNFSRKGSSKQKIVNKQKEIEKYRLENENYRVEVVKDGLKIKPKFLKENVFDGDPFEINFREDRGTLWVEDFQGPIMGRTFEEERIKRIFEGDVFTCFLIEGRVKGIEKGFDACKLWDGFEELAWTKEIFVFNELRHIILNLKLHWKGKNTKIFLTIPTKVNPAKAKSLYEIPFGYIERQPYFEVDFKNRQNMVNLPGCYSTSKGDWPALNWVFYYDDKTGTGVANRGTPGHQLNNGKIMISLLRSPTAKASGFIPDIGSYENGLHHYEFAILPAEPEKIDEVAKFSCDFANPVFAQFTRTDKKAPSEKEFLSIDTEGVVLSSLKISEDESGFIMRIFETEGKEKQVKINLNFSYKNSYEVDLMENITKEINIRNFKIKSFEIKSILLKI